MNRMRIGVIAAAATLVFSACTGAASESPSGTATPGPTSGTSAEPTQGVQPKDGGTLIVAIPGDITSADPSLVSDSNSSYVMINVVEGLLGIKPGTISEVIPVLAADLPEVSEDKLTYTFTLREGITFHDGEPFNADAVVYNYERQLNAPVELRDAYNYYFGAVFQGWAEESNLESVTAVDEFTVEFKLRRPQSTFIISQAPLPQFGIQSPKALQEGDADNPDPAQSPYAQGQGTGMVGTGPFKYEEWVPNDHVTIVKNEDYWNEEGMAHLDEVIFRPFADQTAEFNALTAGDIDLAQTILPNDAESIMDDDAFTVHDRGDSCNVGVLQMNHTHAPLDNPKIREAIAYAVNKQAYIDALYAGQGVPADNWMPPATEHYKALDLPTYDPDAARQAIADANIDTTGDALTIDFWYPSDVSRPYMPDPKGLAEAIATDLEAVGFTINFQTAGWRTGYLRDEAQGLYPMWLLGWTCDWAGPDNFLSTAFFHPDGGEPNKEFAYGPDDLFAAFDAGLSGATDEEVAAAWSEAQDILARDLPTVPLVHSRPPAASASDVMGFVGSGNLNEALNTVWLDR